MREKAPHMEPILRVRGLQRRRAGGLRVRRRGVQALPGNRAIRELGVLLKDLDTGLLDFPHEKDGRVVFLCWHPPEERVGYWHEIRPATPAANPSSSPCR